MSTLMDTVKMCDDPECRLPGVCRNMPAMPLAALSQPVDPAKAGESLLLRIFAQELTLSGCSDDQGVLRLIPPGSEFTVHPGVSDPDGSGRVFYTAVYDGPAATKDEWLAGSPEWTGEAVQARWDAFKAAVATA